MSSLLQQTYTLSFINNYLTSIHLPELNDETIKIINSISEEVGAPTYQKTPVFQNREKKKKSKLTPEDWEEMRNYKATELMKNEEGEEADMDFIRSNLNKLSKKTYDDLLPLIKDKITSMKKNNPSVLSKIGKIVLSIGSVNTFVGDLFCTLYEDLINTYGSVMNDVLLEFWKEYIESFNMIEMVDPDKNYDLFCQNNKKNEDRRSKSKFFINLAKRGNHFDVNKISEIIKNFVELLKNTIEKENKLFMVEEVTENLYILMYENIDFLQDEINDGEWDEINESFSTMTYFNAKDYPSLSQKVLFRIMDIYDEM